MLGLLSSIVIMSIVIISVAMASVYLMLYNCDWYFNQFEASHYHSSVSCLAWVALVTWLLLMKCCNAILAQMTKVNILRSWLCPVPSVTLNVTLWHCRKSVFQVVMLNIIQTRAQYIWWCPSFNHNTSKKSHDEIIILLCAKALCDQTYLNKNVNKCIFMLFEIQLKFYQWNWHLVSLSVSPDSIHLAFSHSYRYHI